MEKRRCDVCNKNDYKEIWPISGILHEELTGKFCKLYCEKCYPSYNELKDKK